MTKTTVGTPDPDPRSPEERYAEHEATIRGESAIAKRHDQEEISRMVGYVADLQDKAGTPPIKDAATAAAELGIDPEEYLEG